MRIGVCDFPSDYAFPPYGYGGIERWLWAAAFGGHQAGDEIFLVGPAWRRELPLAFKRIPLRLEDLRPESEQFRTLQNLALDVLIVGHEYPSRRPWRHISDLLGCRVVTFQHDPDFRHEDAAFDGVRSRLFCYSPEMMLRYAKHHPTQALSVQFGWNEEIPPQAMKGRDLVWLGRIDYQKSPHLAIQAARLLGRSIRLIGPVLDEGYARAYRQYLDAPNVEYVGEVSGAAKLDQIRQAQLMVYTCAAEYVEAGAAVFGESLRSGTPVAALAWRAGTCAEVALCENTGRIANVADLSEQEVVEQLAETIIAAEHLDSRDTQVIGLDRFDPERHYLNLVGHDGF
ncbi:glycosyltransferase involved in cell wall biosynthesis [Actinokineospora baliensis]|uniref:hypothetical protein n=1 Tax=Actinokineospora baliensis TaxID=547056 RepID=UPI00195BB975|nr:hypothetical protein [Actinokineospora baliensis]MBM7771204.1 glycosyltransferase involved in cell wall biosynthesis [Actinokineospora baliensis]